MIHVDCEVSLKDGRNIFIQDYSDHCDKNAIEVTLRNADGLYTNLIFTQKDFVELFHKMASEDSWC